MPSNIELKQKVSDLRSFEELAKSFKANFSKVLNQTDTYFGVNTAKLKLREFDDGNAELIFYDRSGDEKWQSDYIITRTTDSKNLKKILVLLFEELVIVKKKRVLYLFENARIHLDTVDGLGEFIEFEVIIEKGDDQASELFLKLCNHFKIDPKSTIRKSYSDLLIEVNNK